MSTGCPDLDGDTETSRMAHELSTLTNEGILMVRREVSAGVSIADIAARYRLRFRSVLRVVSPHGHRPGTVLGEQPVKQFSRQQADELVRMVYSLQLTYPGLSVSSIARRWGVPSTTLTNYMSSPQRRARLAAEQDAENDAELLK